MTKISSLQLSNTNLINNKKEIRKDNNPTDKTLTIKAAIGLSFVSFCTAAGLVYFAKNTSGLKRIKYNSQPYPLTKTLTDTPIFEETKTIIPEGVQSSKTVDIKPKWNAVTTMHVLKPAKETKKTDKPVNWRERQKSSFIPGIIKQISADIKEYMQKSGIDKKNNKINPEKLDEILTKAVGEDKVTERPFKENGEYGVGRIKEYLSPNGKVYVLEAHESSNGIITRLYMTEKDKHLRAYLHSDGTFRLNSYTTKDSHFATTAKGKRWMEKSKFLTNKSA